MAAVSPTSFDQLLTLLDPDLDIAAEKYEILRLKMIKILVWKGCAESRADALADKVFDRITSKLDQGEKIENANAYAKEILRYVWLEEMRGREGITKDGEMPETAVQPDIELLKDPGERMGCLRRCLVEVVPDEQDRALIVGYYDTEAGGKNKDIRKELARQLGLNMTTLKVKASRIRYRLERCINGCVAKMV